MQMVLALNPGQGWTGVASYGLRVWLGDAYLNDSNRYPNGYQPQKPKPHLRMQIVRRKRMDGMVTCHVRCEYQSPRSGSGQLMNQ
jgi:hypothetical protein